MECKWKQIIDYLEEQSMEDIPYSDLYYFAITLGQEVVRLETETIYYKSAKENLEKLLDFIKEKENIKLDLNYFNNKEKK